MQPAQLLTCLIIRYLPIVCCTDMINSLFQNFSIKAIQVHVLRTKARRTNQVSRVQSQSIITSSLGSPRRRNISSSTRLPNEWMSFRMRSPASHASITVCVSGCRHVNTHLKLRRCAATNPHSSKQPKRVIVPRYADGATLGNSRFRCNLLQLNYIRLRTETIPLCGEKWRR